MTFTVSLAVLVWKVLGRGKGGNQPYRNSPVIKKTMLAGRLQNVRTFIKIHVCYLMQPYCWKYVYLSSAVELLDKKFLLHALHSLLPLPFKSGLRELLLDARRFPPGELTDASCANAEFLVRKHEMAIERESRRRQLLNTRGCEVFHSA